MLDHANTTALNLNPLVATVDGFLSVRECQTLIELGTGRLERATIDSVSKHGMVSESRTNAHCALDPLECPQILPFLMKLGIILRIPLQHAEGFMLLHYVEAQEFKPHSDGIALNMAPERLAQLERNGGQRLFSTLIYLNDVAEGGGTSFPELGITVSPRPGRLLVFSNTMAGTRDVTNLSIHAGEPVTAGEKWAAIAWWRENPRGS